MPPTAYEWEGPIYGRDEDEVRGFMKICFLE